MSKLRIIAEAGVNHNGNLNIAKSLIDHAKIAGADYIKFQSYKTENLVCKNTLMTNYQKKNSRVNSQFQLLKKYELSEKSHKTIIQYCKKKRIKFLSSVFDLESLDLLTKLGIKKFKIPSGEINNYPLLEKISLKANEIFLSTGMSTVQEIKNAIKILIKNNCKLKKKITVMHCTSNYPSDYKDVNLLFLNYLKKFSDLNIGYSDHTIGCETSIAAVALGASVIEKHITLSRYKIGPDHAASMNVKEFLNFVKSLRKTEVLLGNQKKVLNLEEIKNKKLVRKSIVARILIKKGDLFSISNITCKRPEGGISPIFWNKVIGKIARKNFYIDQFIKI